MFTLIVWKIANALYHPRNTLAIQKPAVVISESYLDLKLFIVIKKTVEFILVNHSL
jgi:hypothetical protein